MNLSLSDLQALALVASCSGLAILTIATRIRTAIIWAVVVEAIFVAWTRTAASMVASVFLVGLALCVAWVVRLRRIRDLDDERILVESLATAEARRDAAALDERAHVAREIHDVLAHSLSALAIKLEHVRLEASLLPQGARVAGQIGEARELVVRGIEDARSAVGALRGDDSISVSGMRATAERFSETTGIKVDFSATPIEPGLSMQERLVLFRTLQEALTNAAKHSMPSLVSAHLEVSDSRVTLSITNDGYSAKDPDSAGDSPGYGLAGIGERVALAGGTLESTSTGKEFRVVVCLPH